MPLQKFIYQVKLSFHLALQAGSCKPSMYVIWPSTNAIADSLFIDFTMNFQNRTNCSYRFLSATYLCGKNPVSYSLSSR